MKRRTLIGSSVGSALLGLPFGALAQKSPKILKVATPTNLNTLDPAKTKISDEYNVTFLVYSGLTESDPSGKIQPDLAESWTSTDDLKIWTFKLRRGVKFHNGRLLDAQDVKASIERLLDPATGSVSRVNFTMIDAIDILDPLTIRFSLKLAYSGFADIFADRQAKIVPRDKLDVLASQAIGTGPFKLVEFKPGSHIELAKNPDYYDRALPKLDGVLLKIIPETASRVAALTTAEVDMMWDVPGEALGQLKSNPKIVLDTIPTSTWDGIIMNAAQKPFDDIRVRKALQAAIDKKALVELALFGNGTATHTMISPSNAYFAKDIPIPAPDYALAKKLLAEAGYPRGFEIKFYIPTDRPARERMGVAVRELLKPIGVNVELQRVPQDKLLKEIEGKAAFYIDGFFSRPTLDASIQPFYASTGSFNTALWNYKNPRMDRILADVRAARTDAEKTRLYHEFQELAINEPAGIIPYVVNHSNAMRKEVKGFRSSPMVWLDLKRVWLE